VMLRANVIHADLSPYNILVWNGRAIVIDVPQAVDPRKNRHAEELLRRDVQHVVDYFEHFGVRADAQALSADLFIAWTFADLVPGDFSG
jgi:RIO kinase 1